ncbi:VWA domain-containing protein [Zavarzinia compransoris]|uniref:vWA domain-containing protein n=1 Tax=Zavarzinia marina TaxID=2911065 RepID=UPI001F45E3BB|nr:VWA domain-containing protein [Zavarzinia marina]MCF4166194.1 VWA domain-containing protein [Zavarzinia marina]
MRDASYAPAPAMRSVIVSGGIAPMPPMPAVGGRFEETTANPFKAVAEEPVSTFSSDVDTASYAVVRRFLRDGTLPPEGAVRVEEMINYFPYGHDDRGAEDGPFGTTVRVMPSPWSTDTQLMTVSIKAMEPGGRRRPPLNLVMLVDVSGSMDGDDRLGLVKAGLTDFLDELRPEDRISIVTYAGSVETVLSPTAGDRRGTIAAAIRRLEAGGGTAGGAGLEMAYALARENFGAEAVNRVLLATDGDFNIGPSDPATLADMVEKERKKGIYLSVLGVGFGNLNDQMMQRIAQVGNGNAHYLDTATEARKVLREEAASTLIPVADDVKFQVEFNPARIAEYRLIGYETRMLAREDFNDDKVDAGDIGAGRTVTAIYEIVPVGAKRRVDPLRYGTPAAMPEAGAHRDEIAFLRIRYKRPGTTQSRLMERPVTGRDTVSTLAGASDDQRFAVAVAAYGQKLSGNNAVADMPWDAVAALAKGARGDDPEGYRAEFVQLVRAAQVLSDD